MDLRAHLRGNLPRTSTVVLGVVFLGALLLYLWVRPPTPQAPTPVYVQQPTASAHASATPSHRATPSARASATHSTKPTPTALPTLPSDASLSPSATATATPTAAATGSATAPSSAGSGSTSTLPSP